MKKLLLVFVALLSLTLLNGCNDQGNTVRFDDSGNALNEQSTSENEVNPQVENVPESAVTAEPEVQAPKVEESAQPEANMPEPKAEAKKSETTQKIDPKANNDLILDSIKNGKMETNLSYNVIRGKAPAQAHSIEVNGYKLKKYLPGQKSWSYIAATRMKTMKEGANEYLVKAFGKDGKEIDSVKFSIAYDAQAIPTLPGVGASLWVSVLISIILGSSYLMIRKYNF